MRAFNKKKKRKHTSRSRYANTFLYWGGLYVDGRACKRESYVEETLIGTWIVSTAYKKVKVHALYPKKEKKSNQKKRKKDII